MVFRKIISAAMSAAVAAAVGASAFTVFAVLDPQVEAPEPDESTVISEPLTTSAVTTEPAVTTSAVTELSVTTTVTEVTAVSESTVTSETVPELPPPPDIEYLYNGQATVFETIRMKRSIQSGDGASTMSDYEYMRDFLLRRHDGVNKYEKQVVIRFDTLDLPLDTYSKPEVLDTRLVYVGTSIKIPQHTLKKEGSSHGGWFYNGQNYRDGETFVVPDENVTFTPFWFNYHVLTYLAGDYDDIVGQDMSTVQVTEGTGFDLADSSKFTRLGYNLVGWKCSLDDKVYGTLERYIIPESDITFTAVWSPAPMEITISANNGVITDKITDYALAGEEYTLPECAFTNGDKTFAGWVYNKVIYMPGDKITIPALMKGQRVIIVAKWK